jgi:PAS domain S-box-containing protein
MSLDSSFSYALGSTTEAWDGTPYAEPALDDFAEIQVLQAEDRSEPSESQEHFGGSRTALADAVTLLHSTLESSDDGVVAVDLSGHIVCYNARFVDLWQLPATLLAQRSAHEVKAYIARQIEDGPALLSRAEQSRSNPLDRHVDVFRLHDGRVVERHSSPQRAGRHCIGHLVRWREVTDHTVLREKLLASESMHKKLLESMTDGVFVAQAGSFVFANDALPAMLGYTSDELTGMRLEQVIAPEFLELCKHRFAQRISGADEPCRSYRVRLLKKDAQESVWIELQANRVDYEGERCVLGIVRDVTEQRRAEQRTQMRDYVLERLARGAELESVMHAIVFGTEEVLPQVRCAILLSTPGGRLALSAAPSLPDFMVTALDGLCLDDAALYCGLAMRRGERVVMDDIAESGCRPSFIKTAVRAGLTGSWSVPIMSAAGKVLGVFVAYQAAKGAPANGDAELLHNAANLAGLAIALRSSITAGA